MDEVILLKKLCWCCCCGMCELDQLFECYFDCEWVGVLIVECEVFLFLLECEDDRLWWWFMGYEECFYVELVVFIVRICVLLV